MADILFSLPNRNTYQVKQPVLLQVGVTISNLAL